jgi:SAM-dependent methyltransferase
MAQTTSGLRSLLSLPLAYRTLQWLLGAPRVRRTLAREYIAAAPGQRLLDIGCGTAEILGHLPSVDYTGLDQNESYIRAAQKRYGARGTFVGRDVNEIALGTLGTFDVVLASGFLHHLDDGEVRKLLGLAKSCLKAGGRLITLDCCYQEGQSRVARLLIDWDRGRNTRTEAGYASLASEEFGTVRSSVRHDLLNLPYTHIILVCSP